MKPKASRRKKKPKMRAEINEIETEKINKIKSQFSEKINKIDKTLSRLTRKQERWLK